MPRLIKLNVHAVFNQIRILGLGNIGSAFASGLAPLLDMKKFEVTSPSLCNGTRSTHYAVAKDNPSAAKDADLIILGVKPKDTPAICKEIKHVLKKDAVVVSMAAGVSISTLQDNLPEGQRIIRIMPNTPVKEKLGVIFLTHTPNIPYELIKMFTAMLETVGEVVHLTKEEHMHPSTLLFASGPAFMFLFLQYLDTMADKHGLMLEDKELRRKCFIQLMEGSAVLLKNGNLSFEAARRQVTSPGGTTNATVTSWEKLGLFDVISEGIEAGIARSKEMGQTNTNPNVSKLSVFQPRKVVEENSSSIVEEAVASNKKLG